MLNLNANNEYGMSFSHHMSADQSFYNLYSNASSSLIKDKSEFLYKNQKFDFMNNNTSCNETKDCENSKRFSVNNLLKSSSETPVTEKLSGKALVGSN